VGGFQLNDKKNSGNVIKGESVSKVIEVSRNRIYFYSEIDKENILNLNKTLRNCANDSLNHHYNNMTAKPHPLFLHIHSYGGTIFSGIAGMDQILVLKEEVPIYTIVDGCVASAATFLSMVGSKRFINSNSFMMIHQLSSVMWGKYEEFKDEMQNLDRLMKMIKDFYQKYTKVPDKVLNDILRHDLWWDAKTCIEYGLADEIFTYKNIRK